MDQRLNPHETASTQPSLASSMLAANDNFGSRALAYESAFDLPNHTRDAWTRVDRGVRVPVGVGASQDPRSLFHLPAMESFPPQRNLDERSRQDLDMLVEFSCRFLLRSDPQIRNAIRSVQAVQQQAPNNGQLPSRGQLRAQLRLLLAAQALPVVQVPGNSQLPPNAPASNLAGVPGNSQHPPVAQRLPFGLPQIIATPSLPVANLGPNENLLSEDQGGLSSLPENISTLSPNTLQEGSQRSEPSRDGDDDSIIAAPPTPVSLPNTPSTATIPALGAQSGCTVGRAELPSNDGPNASIMDLTKCFDFNSMLISVPPGHVRSPITGNIRKRQMMDDFPEKMRENYRRQWEKLCAKDRKERGLIEGYEEGDSELELSAWEDEKEKRRKRRKPGRKERND